MHVSAHRPGRGTVKTPGTMDKARVTLGAWLTRKRKTAGLSQAQMAELIGQSEAFVARYEAEGRLGILEFGKIISVLGAEPAEVIGDQGILAAPPSPSRGEGDNKLPHGHYMSDPL